MEKSRILLLRLKVIFFLPISLHLPMPRRNRRLMAVFTSCAAVFSQRVTTLSSLSTAHSTTRFSLGLLCPTRLSMALTSLPRFPGSPMTGKNLTGCPLAHLTEPLAPQVLSGVTRHQASGVRHSTDRSLSTRHRTASVQTGFGRALMLG